MSIRRPWPSDWPPQNLNLAPVNGTRGDARKTFGGKLVDDLVHVMQQLAKDFPAVASRQHKAKL